MQYEPSGLCQSPVSELAQGHEWHWQGWFDEERRRDEHPLTPPVLWFLAGSSQAAAKPSELNNLNLVRASPAGGSLKQLNVLPEISPTLLDLQSEAEVNQALLSNGCAPAPSDSLRELKPPNTSLD